MADANQTDIVSRQYIYSEKCGVSGKSFEWKLKTCSEVSLFSM